MFWGFFVTSTVAKTDQTKAKASAVGALAYVIL